MSHDLTQFINETRHPDGVALVDDDVQGLRDEPRDGVDDPLVLVEVVVVRAVLVVGVVVRVVVVVLHLMLKLFVRGQT